MIDLKGAELQNCYSCIATQNKGCNWLLDMSSSTESIFVAADTSVQICSARAQCYCNTIP